MIPKGLFTQIAMIGLSVGIVISYIQPAFAEISDVQDDIVLYQTERKKVAEVNAQLATLVDRLNAVSALDQRRLLVYMPDSVDTIDVPRVLQFIAEDAGLLFKQVSYGNILEGHFDESDDFEYPTPQLFQFEVEGTYSQIKEMLRLLEQNEYPLEVHGLNIQILDGGFLSAQFSVVTYSHIAPNTNN